MLTLRDFHEYQKRATDFLVNTPDAFLWIAMGLGKTPITLTAFNHLQQHGHARAALVLGPKRVVESGWQKEAYKWDHLQHLTFSKILGTPEQRMAALFKPADIYLTNYENLPWLVAQCQAYFVDRNYQLPFDYLVLDESSKMKSVDALRVQALLQIRHLFTRHVGLTGSPASNGLIDLFGQFLCVDGGARLGTTIEAYRNNYFKPAGYRGRSYEIAAGMDERIHHMVHDITLEMAQSDYLELPELIVNDIDIVLPPKARKIYDEMEKTFFAELDDGEVIEVESEVARINKNLQVCSGFVYLNPETRDWSRVHDAKLDALEDIIEEAAGKPVYVAYTFKADAERIMKKFKHTVNFTGMSGPDFNVALNDFAAGRTPLAIGNVQSLSHGVDGMQDACSDIVMYGFPWSLEYYVQVIARIHRQGQKEPVRLHRLIASDTLDEVVTDRLASKDMSEQALRRAVNQYRQQRGL